VNLTEPDKKLKKKGQSILAVSNINEFAADSFRSFAGFIVPFVISQNLYAIFIRIVLIWFSIIPFEDRDVFFVGSLEFASLFITSNAEPFDTVITDSLRFEKRKLIFVSKRRKLAACKSADSLRFLP